MPNNVFLQCSVSVFLFVVISLNETQTLLHTYIIQFKNELYENETLTEISDVMAE